MKDLNDGQKWLKSLNNDRVLKTILNNSHLTDTQFKTLLTDIKHKYLINNEKVTPNQSQHKIYGSVTRGSFNRTLKQAQKNILRSIYTLLLLGYLNIADTSSLFLQFLEVSNKLKDYAEMSKNITDLDENGQEYLKALQNELEEILIGYSSTKLDLA